MTTREQEYAAKIYNQVEGIKNKIETAKRKVKELKEQLDADTENGELKKQLGKSKKEVEENKKIAEEYKANAKNLPFLIRSAGLVQALYFTHSRMSKLVEHLADVVEKKVENQTPEQHTTSFLTKVRESDINGYMYLTEKCMLALKWYKRCVDIHIEDKEQRTVKQTEVEKDENDKA